jgi:oxygen-independent coproporphyrinogen III oxidase
MKELIKKYDKVGPRYTSFPPVPFWQKPPTEEQWFDHIDQYYSDELGVDIYIHVPFCEKLCYYCACNRVITKDKVRGSDYVALLKKEWDLYQSRSKSLRVGAIHLGGGTPNFLPPDALADLLNHFSGSIDFERFIGSIEVDPRTLSLEHLDVLAKFGFRRISMGVQDFDHEVQKSVNRIQSFDLISTINDSAREVGFESINFDLIYGLPKQSIATVSETIAKVISLKPELIAFYSFAYVPASAKSQNILKQDELPLGEEKRSLYEVGKKLLEQGGYTEIGMDHFALKGSYLESARANKNLKRSFMGYSDKKSNILISLGATSISNTPRSFIQNYKGVEEYTTQIEKGRLAIRLGHVQSDQDMNIDDTIQSIMCNGEANIAKMRELGFWSSIEIELSEMASDGILKMDGDMLYVTELGNVFVRNIAMIFDPNLRNEKSAKPKFSRTI